MDTLLSIDSSLEPNLVKTDRLFFDQYTYCVRIVMPDIFCIRALKKSEFDLENILDYIRQYYKKVKESRQKSGFYRYNNKKFDHDKKYLDKILDLVDFLYPYRSNIKIVLSGDWGTFYTNDLNFVSELLNKKYASSFDLRQAVVSRPRDTVCLQSSKFEHRSYFAEKNINEDTKENLKKYLISQPDIRIGPGLKSWLAGSNQFRLWRTNFIQRYYFIDHNDPGFAVMLSLIVPGLIRKTISIVKVNN